MMEFNHFIAVVGMIKTGLGVSALPMVYCPAPRLLLAPTVTRDLGVLTRNLDGTASRHIPSFHTCLRSAAEGSPAP
ncbi:hypothetical protein V8J36_16150 [Frigidibacter sp. MR17.14]|uniref:hypothetical protein n=1 Tax=Frigidibacter sp. MR17.14 TaxID=3126509 RepID=UPI00301317A1